MLDIIDAMLLCAVRVTHENLIESLGHSFEVTAWQQFQFEYMKDEQYSKAGMEALFPLFLPASLVFALLSS